MGVCDKIHKGRNVDNLDQPYPIPHHVTITSLLHFAGPLRLKFLPLFLLLGPPANTIFQYFHFHWNSRVYIPV